MRDLNLWGYNIARAALTPSESDYLASLPEMLPTVEWVWEEMDRIWHSFGLDNTQPLSSQRVADFYSHPVWILNGIFTACDPVSHTHRQAIAKYLVSKGVKKIADYGGGFGELALAFTSLSSDIHVEVIEPYPSAVGLARIENQDSVSVMPELGVRQYDAIIAQDVLEHVEDPIRMAGDIAGAVREGGKAVFANCFSPVIQSHLPSTFHLRHTFPLVMKALGLRYIGTVDGAAHAQVFERTGQLSLARARRVEAISRLFGPVLNEVSGVLGRIKHLVLR